MKITREQLRTWDACYSDERIAELVPPEGLTPLAVCDLDIPADDRLWVVLREEIIPARQLREFACDVAEEACRAAGVTDPRSLAAIQTSRRYARGMATEGELRVARDAAMAARDAAWAAAMAARDAATDAARDAAWAAAWAAARESQLSRVRAILGATYTKGVETSALYVEQSLRCPECLAAEVTDDDAE